MSYTSRSNDTERTITEIDAAPEQALDLLVDDDSPIVHGGSASPQLRDGAA